MVIFGSRFVQARPAARLRSFDNKITGEIDRLPFPVSNSHLDFDFNNAMDVIRIMGYRSFCRLPTWLIVVVTC